VASRIEFFLASFLPTRIFKLRDAKSIWVAEKAGKVRWVPFDAESKSLTLLPLSTFSAILKFASGAHFLPPTPQTPVFGEIVVS